MKKLLHVSFVRASYSASVVQLYCVEQSGNQDTQDGTGASVKTHSPLTEAHSLPDVPFTGGGGHCGGGPN